ncbi:MAG: 1-deoxy-D-xylulose-5-phosphate reductoisomerase [Candidatus Obscuribacterales bacterium]|nr:1-deoxy-D-xylulose-5-phosphate reductoisomerase [Candidatus Obscuribacterales bacterium]
MKSISILGSTGSIGKQTLDIVKAHQDDFQVVALAAGSNNLSLLKEQIEFFKPSLVSVPGAKEAKKLQELLGTKNSALEIDYGLGALDLVASHSQADTVVSGVVGALGILPTAAAIRAGKTVALANKETLVAAGSIIMPMLQKYGAKIVPVDSEHSAIHQSLNGYSNKDVKRILLTASGGPFRTWNKEQIESATMDDALKHPNWSMGQKITIDSATLMNKGLEIIEARWLFAIEAARIDVLVHPQSILHSAVEFIDNSVVGQLGVPDMHLPIHYALYFPERRTSLSVPLLDLIKIGSLTFEAPDYEKFPCLRLAKEVADDTGTAAAVLNAANEVAVSCFLERQIRFVDIARYIEKVLDLHQKVARPSLDDILEADRWARSISNELIGAKVR